MRKFAACLAGRSTPLLGGTPLRTSEGVMKLRIFSLILLSAFAPAAPAQSSEQSRPPIIDVHVHAYAANAAWALKVPNPRSGQPMTATTEQAHMQATFAEMKRNNIVKAIVSNHYEAVLRWKAASPDQIIVSYGFDDLSSFVG
jgi:hypothetical protein